MRAPARAAALGVLTVALVVTGSPAPAAVPTWSAVPAGSAAPSWSAVPVGSAVPALSPAPAQLPAVLPVALPTGLPAVLPGTLPAMLPGASAPASVPAILPTAGKAAKPSRILLTPTADPATSQTVSWTMPRKQARQRVQYREVGGAKRTVRAARRPATTKRSSGTRAPRYSATMTGLRAGTRYQYRILTRGRRTAWREFRTTDPRGRSVTMIGLGDTQVANRRVPRRTIRRAVADAPEASLVLQAGDLVDRPYRASQWSALFSAIGGTARTRNWVVSIGNHEQCVLVTRCRSGRAQAFRSYFDWPTNGFPDQGETWFWFDHEGVRVVVLDSFGGQMERQAAFLEQALDTNPQRWSIVLMHAPPFATRPGRSNDGVRRLWLPIIEAHDVDLVLSGHDHSYARGHLTEDGPVYAVSVSGPKYYQATDADWRAHGATREAWAAATSTYQVIRIEGDRLSYEAVVSARGPGSTSPGGPGTVLDRFTITKSPSGVKDVA